MDSSTVHALTSASVFSALGIIILIAAFLLFDIFTPQYNLWKEIIEKQNTALSILLGAFTIGLALIIASAVHS